LKPVSKGWFNVNETRIEAYLAGPLRRQLKETGFIMQVELTQYVCRCARELLKMIEVACEGDSLVLKKNLVEVILCPEYKAIARQYEKQLKEEERELAEFPNSNGGDSKIFPQEFLSARRKNDLLNVDRIPPFFTVKLKVMKKTSSASSSSSSEGANADESNKAAGVKDLMGVRCEDEPAKFVEAVDRMLEVLSTVAGIHQVCVRENERI
jgi:hypothetical protein